MNSRKESLDSTLNIPHYQVEVSSDEDTYTMDASQLEESDIGDEDISSVINIKDVEVGGDEEKGRTG